MSELQIIKVDQEPVLDLPEEHISGILLPRSTFSSASVGIVEAYAAQTPHYHTRPGRGVEVVFVYQGSFQVITERGVTGEFNVDADGPIYLQIPSGAQASIKNVSNKEVKFFTVFSPPFQIGEINFLE